MSLVGFALPRLSVSYKHYQKKRQGPHQMRKTWDKFNAKGSQIEQKKITTNIKIVPMTISG